MYKELELNDSAVTGVLINSDLEKMLNEEINRLNPIMDDMIKTLIEKKGTCSSSDFEIELTLNVKIKGDGK